MENKNNGRGIFYGVIGVATLVVAIIGATFAYFTATAGTNNSPINVAATRVDLQITDQQSNLKTNLIPVDTVNDDGPVTAFYRYPGLTNDGSTGTGTCLDNVGNSICSVYQVTVTNPSGSPTQSITGSLTPVVNDFTNLKYAVFSGDVTTVADAASQFNVNDTPTTASQAGTGRLIYAGTVGTIAQADEWITGEGDDAVNHSIVQLDGAESTVYTIVVWLEDTGEEQNTEMGAKFAANVTFKSAEGSEVTGIITPAP